LHGSGANGKTTFLNAIQAVLGDYAMQTAFSTFAVSRNEGTRNDIARMKGARFVASTEANDGSRFDEAVVKQLTGGDRIAARFLYQEYFEFTPVFKLFIGANYKPTVFGQDNAMWRRIKLIPFEVAIPPEEQDKNLPEKLLAEKSGILNWSLAGCTEWQKNGLQHPDQVSEATAEYKSEMDILREFSEDCCIIGDGFKVERKLLYSEYRQWCDDNSEKPLGRNRFNRKIEAKGIKLVSAAGLRCWKGIGLKV
jgi:putative DNA primase/helicase